MGGGKLDWFDGDGEPDLNALGRYIGASMTDNKGLALSLKRLKEALEADKAERREVGCCCWCWCWWPPCM